MHEVNCPRCGKAVPWQPESRWRPFCSERCRMIDLGQWFAEEHAIPGEPTEPDENFATDPENRRS